MTRYEDEYAREFLGLVDDRATDYKNSRVAQNKTNVGPQAREAYKRTLTITPSDAPAPLAPTNFAATALARAVRLTWDTPPADQYVALTEVEYTPSGQSAVTVKVDANATTLTGLTVGATHAIRIRHINQPGGEDQPGAWSSTIVRTPLHTKAEEVSLSLAGSIEAGGSISVNGANSYIRAGGAEMNADGLHLRNAFTATDTMWPGNNSADWLTGPTGTHPSGTGTSEYVGIATFDQTSPNRRGLIISAVGVSTTTKKGELILRATDGYIGSNPAGQEPTAQIKLSSGVGAFGEGVIDVHGWLFVDDDMQVTGNVVINGALEATGQVDLTNIEGWMEGGYITATPTIMSAWWGYRSGALPTLQIRRIGNFVFMSGRVGNNRSAGTDNNDGHPIVSTSPLPSNFRPATSKMVLVPRQTNGVYDAQSRMWIHSSGEIQLAASANNAVGGGQDISFDGVYYSIN